MRPTPDEVASRRHVVRTALRAVGATLLILYVAKLFTYIVGNYMNMNTWVSTPRGPGLGQQVLLRAVFESWWGVLGIAMLVLDMVGLRWLVPIGTERCIRCGHDASALARCPECGLELAPPEPPARGA